MRALLWVSCIVEVASLALAAVPWLGWPIVALSGVRHPSYGVHLSSFQGRRASNPPASSSSRKLPWFSAGRSRWFHHPELRRRWRRGRDVARCPFGVDHRRRLRRRRRPGARRPGIPAGNSAARLRVITGVPGVQPRSTFAFALDGHGRCVSREGDRRVGRVRPDSRSGAGGRRINAVAR